MQVERGPALCDARRELEPGCDDVCYGIYYVRSVYIVYVAITLIMRIIPLSPLLPSSVVVFRPTSLPFSHPPISVFKVALCLYNIKKYITKCFC